MSDCIFCEIAKKNVESNIVMESENVVSFYDKTPAAKVHILVISKRHVETTLDLLQDKKLLVEMFDMAKKIVKSKKIGEAYKLVFNGGRYQYVSHAHLHILGGEMKKEAV